jgi:hypothetical protein
MAADSELTKGRRHLPSDLCLVIKPSNFELLPANFATPVTITSHLSLEQLVI